MYSTVRRRYVCCVPNCSQSTYYKFRKFKFYCFPKNKNQLVRRKFWISIIREKNGRSSWHPSKNARICSAHFIGGRKSNDPEKENYNPTIFPGTLNKKSSQTRRKKIIPSNANINMKSPHANQAMTQEIGTQTDQTFYDNIIVPDVIFCQLDSSSAKFKNASTQTVIKIIPDHQNNRHVAPHIKLLFGFRGFEDIKDEFTMKQLTGISMEFFSVLVKFVKMRRLLSRSIRYYKILSAENRLLLFLMKMRLPVSYCALACFFHVDKMTAAKIFVDVLENIYDNVNNWITWPSREAIQEQMPAHFKNYTKCRAIIDCTELICEYPPNIQQRVLMFSKDKSRFTLKYLIAVSPSGLITFISKGYGGRTTDDFIIDNSGFLNLLEPGDLILAEKGFPQTKNELSKRNCTLAMPPFATNSFLQQDEFERYSIDTFRLEVQKLITQLKTFNILSYVPITMLVHIDKIIQIACVLANNKKPDNLN